jgi:hypothetical protein
VAQLENLTTMSTMVERLAALESGSTVASRPDGAGLMRKPTPAPLEPFSSPPRRSATRSESAGDSPGAAPAPARADASAIAAPQAVQPDRTPSVIGGVAASDEPQAADSASPAPSTAVVAPSTSPAAAVRGGEKRRSAFRRSTAPRGGGPSRVPAESESSLSAPSRSPAAGDSPSPEIEMPAGAESQPVDLPPLELAKAREVWPDLIKKVGANLGWRLSQVEPVAALGADVLVIAAKPGYNSMAEVCGTPEALLKIEQGLQRLIHRPVSVRYERSSDSGESAADSRPGELSRAESVNADPMVQKVMELFEARPCRTNVNDAES